MYFDVYYFLRKDSCVPPSFYGIEFGDLGLSGRIWLCQNRGRGGSIMRVQNIIFGGISGHKKPVVAVKQNLLKKLENYFWVTGSNKLKAKNLKTW